ncbi:hypothetical protein [Thermomonas hydrothermalis]|uniref:Methyltransferase domain-containing protein n=1 Tax=Thermomonas hydrothermalis TaxID=213588 RepID=A0A1M4Y4Q5_9GAMM|nr:hypothetical protein [Thermomonas hydrothermalis]SHF00741.1 hypothetical protein SAMN02745204_01593 [Thermomonas hydrothermalis]
MPAHRIPRQSDPMAATHWFAEAAGRALLASEAACVADALRQRIGPSALWLAPLASAPVASEDPGVVVRLHPETAGFDGTLRCTLPLPLVSEGCAVVVVQHVLDLPAVPASELLEDCVRVLAPGGWLWLLSLNPLSPYRWRWRGSGLRAREPIGWRRQLRAAGLTPDSISQGLGPVWAVTAAAGEQEGAGLRAGYLLRAQKRVRPLTPVRPQRAIVGWQASPSA